MIQDIFLFKLTYEAFAGIHFQNQKSGNLLQCIRTISCAASAALGPAAVTDNQNGIDGDKPGNSFPHTQAGLQRSWRIKPTLAEDSPELRS